MQDEVGRHPVSSRVFREEDELFGSDSEDAGRAARPPSPSYSPSPGSPNKRDAPESSDNDDMRGDKHSNRAKRLAALPATVPWADSCPVGVGREETVEVASDDSEAELPASPPGAVKDMVKNIGQRAADADRRAAEADGRRRGPSRQCKKGMTKSKGDTRRGLEQEGSPMQQPN
jgi:hypothetical protein